MEKERNPIPANFYVAAAQAAGIPQPERDHNNDEYTQLGNSTFIDPPLVGPESDSLVRRGGQVAEDHLPSELSGSLQRISHGLTEVSQGVLEGSNGSTRVIAIKRLKNTGHIDRSVLVGIIGTAALHWEKVKHPNILQFIGYKIVYEAPCLVSPWCQCGDIVRYISENPGLMNSDKLKLLCDAARGLKYLHSLVPPIAHGAIKPSNVLVMDNLEAGLCDWGHWTVFASITRRDAPRAAGESRRWERVGGYQAKELLSECTPPATAAADVFAFGGLILAAMSGKDPFWRKRNEAARIIAICMDQVPRPEEHPLLSPNDPLWSLMTECWSENSEARPSMELVLRQLERERDRRRIHENS